MTHSRPPALAAFLCLFPLLAAAAPTWDLGARADIYEENYKLGVGAELGLILPANPGWDFGLHLNYGHYEPQNDGVVDAADEFGGYVAAYYKPKIDQAFWLRLGPHLGYAHIVDHFADLGGDVMAVFKATPTVDFYATIIPSLLIGGDTQPLIRIGLGVEITPGR